jgi:hypothetical protein
MQSDATNNKNTMNRTEPNNLRLHYASAATKRQKQNFHKTLLLWAYLFAVAGILAGAFAYAL